MAQGWECSSGRENPPSQGEARSGKPQGQSWAGGRRAGQGGPGGQSWARPESPSRKARSHSGNKGWGRAQGKVVRYQGQPVSDKTLPQMKAEGRQGFTVCPACTP